MKPHPGVVAILAVIVTLLTLAACGIAAGTPSVTSSEGLLLPMATQTIGSCEGCAQATLAALQTQEKSGIDAQAAATAEIMRANAQATLNAANSTQSAALTQDAIRQTQVQYSQQVTADVATQNSIATVTQENNNFLAASTQTVVANLIATQTQSAVATSQWFADQVRLRDEQRQAPITFLWLWCPPLFIVAIALVGLLFFWRWMKIRETQQLIDMQPQDPIIIEHKPRQLREIVRSQNQPKPTDHVHRWLDEAKRKLQADEKDDNDHPDS